MRTGRKQPGDPQFDIPSPPMGPIANVKTIQDGEVLRVGDVAITAHKTGGHTPGSTSWTWRSCEDKRCVDMVYADSMTAVSADTFRFSDNKTYPQVIDDFKKSHAFLRKASCDILITPHPGASALWERLEKGPTGLVDREACKRYAATARQALARRLERERSSR